MAPTALYDTILYNSRLYNILLDYTSAGVGPCVLPDVDGAHRRGDGDVEGGSGGAPRQHREEA